jgi:hypothetical protein
MQWPCLLMSFSIRASMSLPLLSTIARTTTSEQRQRTDAIKMMIGFQWFIFFLAMEWGELGTANYLAMPSFHLIGACPALPRP